MPRLRFDKTGDKYFVYCRGENLGEIYYFKDWKCWVWQQEIDIVMSSDCLNEVIQFMNKISASPVAEMEDMLKEITNINKNERLKK